MSRSIKSALAIAAIVLTVGLTAGPAAARDGPPGQRRGLGLLPPRPVICGPRRYRGASSTDAGWTHAHSSPPGGVAHLAHVTHTMTFHDHDC